MKTTLRAWALAATALAGVGVTGERPARAQNTYWDVPFNQGSLFYRYSGSKPPATTNSSNRPRRGLFRRAQTPTYYSAPTPAPAYRTPYVTQPATTYYYPPAR